MSNTSSGKYFVKKTANGTFQDITSLFDGVGVLKIDGFLKKGEPVNIYTAQWIAEQEEDFVIPQTTANTPPVVIRKNVDIDITFIIRQKYATSPSIDVQATHDYFIEYMTNSDIWIKSAYVSNKYVHCVCLSEYEPTTVKLDRGRNSYIMGTLKLHCLDAPQ